MGHKVKKCKYCRQPIDKKATVCHYCGKKQGLTRAEIIVYTVIIVAVMIFGLKACNGIRSGYDRADERAAVSSEARKYSESEYKNICRIVTYEELARDKNALKGEKVTVTGEVIQVMDNIYRMNITKNDHGYSDAIVFELDSDKLSENILENDIITVWGESKGFYTYKSITGQEVTAPDINVVYVENNGRDSDN